MNTPDRTAVAASISKCVPRSIQLSSVESPVTSPCPRTCPSCPWSPRCEGSRSARRCCRGSFCSDAPPLLLTAASRLAPSRQFSALHSARCSSWPYVCRMGTHPTSRRTTQEVVGYWVPRTGGTCERRERSDARRQADGTGGVFSRIQGAVCFNRKQNGHVLAVELSLGRLQ